MKWIYLQWACVFLILLLGVAVFLIPRNAVYFETALFLGWIGTIVCGIGVLYFERRARRNK